MNFYQQHILLHGGNSVKVLVPQADKERELAATTNHYGDHTIFGNRSVFQRLEELFLISCDLRINEIIFYPLDFAFQRPFEIDYSQPATYYTSLVLSNYHTSQISRKKVQKEILAQLYKVPKKTITIPTKETPQRAELWKSGHQLTVMPYGKSLFFSANTLIYRDLAFSSFHLSSIGDTEEQNFSSHFHYNLWYPTSKSQGVTLYYWQHPENP